MTITVGVGRCRARVLFAGRFSRLAQMSSPARRCAASSGLDGEGFVSLRRSLTTGADGRNNGFEVEIVPTMHRGEGYDAEDLGDLNAEIGVDFTAAGTTSTYDVECSKRTGIEDVNANDSSLQSRHRAATGVVSQAELKDFNEEIGGFIGTLGDPDFDFQNSTRPTTPVNQDNRRHFDDKAGNRGHTSTSKAHDPPGSKSANDDWSEPRRRPHGDRDSRMLRNNREKDEVATMAMAHTHEGRRRRRLTLADHPPWSPLTAAGGPGAARPTALDDYDDDDDGDDDDDNASEIHSHQLVGNQTPSRSHDKLQDSVFRTTPPSVGDNKAIRGQYNSLRNIHPERRRNQSDGELSSDRTRTERSILVLNGAACFIRNRLASTGESAEQIAASLESAAAEHGLRLTVCTSNSEADLLDRICGDDYDAIIYNPAGFNPAPTSSKNSTDTPNTTQTPLGMCSSYSTALGETLRLAGRETPNLVDYGLNRARCPVVKILPRDYWQNSTGCSSNLNAAGANSGNFRGDGAAVDVSVISGFSGAASYQLAMAAVAMLLQQQDNG